MLLVSVAAFSLSIPAAAYGQAAQTTGAGNLRLTRPTASDATNGTATAERQREMRGRARDRADQEARHQADARHQPPGHEGAAGAMRPRPAAL
jgi:hypothetical protein